MSSRRRRDEEDECRDDTGFNWMGAAFTAIGVVIAAGVGFFLGQRAERENLENRALMVGAGHPPIVDMNDIEQKTCSPTSHITRLPSTTSTSRTSPISDECEDTDAHLCKICYEQHLNAVLLPCRHQIACESCSQNLAICPVCRETITQVLGVYRS